MDVGGRPEVVRDVVQLGGHALEPLHDGAERELWISSAASATEIRSRAPRSVPSAASAAPAAARWASASASSDSSASRRSSSPGSVRPTRSISSSWNRRKSSSRSRAPASPPRPSSTAAAARTAARAASRSARSTDREPIEGPALAGGGEEPDVGVLSVQVDEGGGQLGQLRGGDQLAVAVGARTTVAGHHAREDDLVVVDHEASLDDGLVGARAHHRRIGAIPGQEPDGADEHRLAGARLARERGHPGIEDQRHPLDDAEVADGQLSEHVRPSPGRHGGWDRAVRAVGQHGLGAAVRARRLGGPDSGQDRRPA